MDQKIVIGNCLDVLRDMEPESVDVCVTSPPYWALRDYGTDPVIWDGGDCEHEWADQYCAKCGAWRGQLGLEPTPNEYIRHLLQIFDEVKRVLRPSGSCWVNIGDTYSTVKSLVQIPSRFAIAMCDHGWILRNEIIWQKPNVMPTSVTDRFTVDFEKFYFFVKEPKYYFKQQKEAVKCPDVRTRFAAGGRKDGNSNTIYSGNTYDASELGNMRNKRAIWNIPTKASPLKHCAMFPIELVRVPIDSCCPQGGTVLDPFCGSGTTLEYCFEHGIRGIGIEINPDYRSMIEYRSKHGQSKLGD